MALQYSKGAYTREGSQFFTQVASDKTRENGHKLKEGRFKLELDLEVFLLEEWRSAGMGCPDRLWIL